LSSKILGLPIFLSHARACASKCTAAAALWFRAATAARCHCACRHRPRAMSQVSHRRLLLNALPESFSPHTICRHGNVRHPFWPPHAIAGLAQPLEPDLPQRRRLPPGSAPSTHTAVEFDSLHQCRRPVKLPLATLPPAPDRPRMLASSTRCQRLPPPYTYWYISFFLYCNIDAYLQCLLCDQDRMS
jgi:hypothetical protein